MAAPFAMALGVFLFGLFANRLVRILQLVFAKGATLKYAGSLMLTLLPAFLVYAIPMAFILAILLAYGRLSSDSEIVAMRASGVGLWALTRPAFEAGVLLAAFTMILSIWAVPWGKHQFAVEVFKLASNQINVGIEERVFNTLGDGVMLYADRVDQGKLSGVLLSDTRSETEHVEIFAESGELRTREGEAVLELDLHRGRLLSGNAVSDTTRAIDFERFRLRLDLSEQVGSRTWYNINEMNLSQLKEELKQERTQSDVRRQRSVLLEIHKNFTLPVGCLLFPFLGIPLAMTNRRSGKTQGFVTALVVIVGYYMLMTTGQNAAKNGRVPVWVGAWSANFVLLIVSGWFYGRMSAGKSLLPRVIRR